MNFGDKRAEQEELILTVELFNLGMSLSEIGRRLGRHHSTILVRLRKLGLWNSERKYEPKLPKFFRYISTKSIKKRIAEKKELEEMKIETGEIKIETVKCKQCEAEKTNPVWFTTRYCSMECWSKANTILVGNN